MDGHLGIDYPQLLDILLKCMKVYRAGLFCYFFLMVIVKEALLDYYSCNNYHSYVICLQRRK